MRLSIIQLICPCILSIIRIFFVEIYFGIVVIHSLWYDGHIYEFLFLGEELGETPDFCQTSDLSCFLLENIEDGSLKVVSIGTGSK